MAAISWKNAVTANWTTAADWSTGTVPGAADDATLGLSNGYTVSIATLITVDSISLTDKSAVLSVNASGQTVTIVGGLLDDGTVDISNAGGQGGTTVAIGGTLTDNNLLTIGNSSLSAPTLVTANTFIDAGSLAIAGSASKQAALEATAGSAPGVLSGTITLSGDSLLQFANGQISEIAGSGRLVLTGASAFIADAPDTSHNSALTGLDYVAGDFELQGGASAALSGGLAVSGSLNLDTQTGASGSTLSIAGSFNNAGTTSLGRIFTATGGTRLIIAGPLNNSGSFNILDEDAAATMVTAASLSNTGTLDLDGEGGGDSVLDLTAGTAPNVLISTITLSGDSLLEFAAGQIGSIGGTGELVVGTSTAFVADASDTAHDSALTGLTSVAGLLGLQSGAAVALTGGLTVTGTLDLDSMNFNTDGATLTVAGDLTNSGTVNVDSDGGNGGATLTIAGALDNNGTINIGTGNGGGNLSAPTTVSAAALGNTGSITIWGNVAANSTDQATLDIVAAAPDTWVGSLSLTGDALLQFASGGITAIASGAQLTITDADAFVADAGATGSSSALTGLSTIAGLFGLQSGASLSLTGGLSVTGTLDLDALSFNTKGAALTVAGDLTNSGTINVDSDGGNGGATLTIDGTLNNTGTVNIGTGNGGGNLSAPTTVSAAALGNTGTISIWGNIATNTANRAALDISAAAAGTWTNTLNLTGDALLQFASGGITAIAQGAQLTITDSDASVADAGATGTNSALTGMTSVAGLFALQSGASLSLIGGLSVTGTLDLDALSLNTEDAALTVAGDLTNSGTVNVDTNNSNGGATLTIDGMLDNTATVNIGGGNLAASTTVSAAGLNNTGTITIEGNTTANTTKQATLDIGAVAPTALTGTVALNGDALLEFASGSITSIATGSTLTLSSPNSFVADASNTAADGALADLQIITGTLALQGGASLATTDPLAVSGTVSLKHATLTVAGAVTLTAASAGVSIDAQSAFDVTGGNSFIQDAGTTTVAGALNASLIDVAGGKMDLTAGVSSGNFEVGGDGVLEFDGSVAGSVTVAFTDATGTLQLNDPSAFAATISGAEVGDVIHLVNTTVTGLSFANGVLTALGSSGTVASLALSGSYTQSDFSFISDGSGGTNIVVIQGTAGANLWTKASNAAWTTAADWSSGEPTAPSNVLIGVPGSYTVTLGASQSVNSITVQNADATLEVDAGEALAVAGTVSNAGTVNLIGNPKAGGGAAMTVGGDFVNTGTLGVDDYDFFFPSGDSTLTIVGTLSNSGTVSIGNSSRLTIETKGPVSVTAGSVQNTGTINVDGESGAEATLDVTGQAAPATLVGGLHVASHALAEFAGGGITTVAATGNLAIAGTAAFVAVTGATNSNSALTGLTSNAGTIVIEDGAALTATPAGGTFINSGNFSAEGNNVADDSDGGQSTAGAEVTIAGNFDNTGTLGVDDYDFFGEAGGSTVIITGALTNSGTITIGCTSRLNIQTSAPAMLTVGSLQNSGTINVDGETGAEATLDVTGGTAPAVLNAGLHVAGHALVQYASGGITAVAFGGNLAVAGPDAFVAVSGASNSNSALAGLTSNAGTIVFEDGAVVATNPAGGTFTNSGSFGVEGNNVADDGDNGQSAAGAEVTVAGNFENTGTLGVDEYSFFGTAGGSTLTITGTLANSGTFQIGNHAGFGVPSTTAPATVLAAALDNSGSIALYGVTGAQATLDIAGAAPSVIDTSIELRGTALVEFGSGSVVSIASGGALVLFGAACIIADSSNTAVSGALSGLDSIAGDFQLQDGPAVAVGGDLAVAGTGTVEIDTQSQAVGSVLSVAGDFSNSGTIKVGGTSGGASTLSIAGALNNAGTINLDDGTTTAPITINAATFNNTGTLVLTGNASAAAAIDISGAAPGVFTGLVTLNTNALLKFGGGSFTSIAFGGSLTLNGGGALVADAGTAGDTALAGLMAIDGTLSLLNGAGVVIAGSLTAAGTLDVDAANNSTGASSLKIAGALDNQADVAIGNANISAQSTILAGALTNEGGGTVTLTGSTSGATATLIVQTDLVNAGNVDMKPGAFVEAGSLDNSGILTITGSAGAPSDLGVIGNATNSGTITIGADAELGVSDSFSDSGTLVLAGTLDLSGPMTLAANASIVMQGGTIIDPNGGTLTVATGATLVGNGIIAVPIVNNGTIAPSGGLLDITGAITGTGQLTVGAGSVLEIGTPTSETVAFNGNVGTLKLDAPASFTGAITGLVTGDAVDLAGIQATSAVVNGSTLTVTAGTQTLNYQVSGPSLASNLFAIENDQHGGSDLVLGTPGPVIAGPTAQTVFAGVPALLGPFSVADPTAGAGALTVTVTDTAGVLSAVASGAGTVGGSGTTSLTLSGDLTDLNAELASLTYGAATNGTDTVNIHVTDIGGLIASQADAITTETVPLTPPALNGPSNETIAAGTPSGIQGLSVVDPSASITGTSVTLTLSDQGGIQLSASGGPGGSVTGQGTGTLVITGTVAQVNSYLGDGVLGLLEFLEPTFDVLKDGINGELTSEQIVTSAAGPEGKFFQVGVASVTYAIQSLIALVPGNGPAPEFSEFIKKLVEILTGEPHLVTYSGQTFDLEAAGEFLLTGSTQTGDSFEVQVRLQPYNGSQADSVVTQVAAGIGTDSVTIGIDRADPVYVDGNPETISSGQAVSLSGGELTQTSANSYQILWNTGEVLSVTDYGTYLDLSVALGAGDSAGSLVGLMGPDTGAANDFTLSNGTVLSQPLTSAELAEFATAWRIPQQFSLFNYGAGQSTATFTDLNFPEAAVSLSELPASIVAVAAQVVAAAGITDPAAAAAAEFDYIATGGDPSVVTSDAAAFQGITATQTTVTPSSPPATVLGVMGEQQTFQVSSSAATSVTFDVYLTAAEATDTAVNYSVVAPEADDLDAAAFSGTFPSGSITIAAGQTGGQFTIDVPQGALGSDASDNLVVQIASPGGVPIFAATAQTQLYQPEAGPPAIPQLEYLGPLGNFTKSGNNYTLDLGALQIGEALPTLQFGIVNAATAPADDLTGTVTWSSVAGLSVDVDGVTTSGVGLPQQLAAGDSFQGINVTAGTGLDVTQSVKVGPDSETITFDPVDTNASGFSASLAPLTLTIADTLEMPGLIYSQAFGDVHIITYSGLEYDFQATGDFVLAQSRIPGDNFQIQMQLAPWYSGATVTTIQEVAIALGADDVTFAWNRGNTVLVDGAAPANLSIGNPLTLAGGTITEISPSMYQVSWNTGETMTVSNVTPFYPGYPAFISITDGVPGNVAPGAYAGLQGENEGTQNDFQLANGTVLSQPLTTAELYGEYANSWAVSPSTSLFDAPLLPESPPSDPLTLAQLPQCNVDAATAAIAAAGITDPGLLQAAELDFAVTGDPAIVAADANIQQQVVATTVANITQSSPPAVAVGVMADTQQVTELPGSPTPVDFSVCMTGAEASDTVVDYTVIAPGAGFLGASAFGGTVPTGSIDIAAGQTEGSFTINVPQGALGADPSDILEVQISDPDNVPVFAPTAQTVIVNDTPEPGNPAQPLLAKIGGDGTLTFNAATSTYTLALGGLAGGSALEAVELAVVNAATFPSDNLSGTFTAPIGSGYTITGNNLTSVLAPGQSYQGLYVAVNTNAIGSHSMSLTFDPTDVNDSGYSTALTPITLNITDDVAPAAQAQVNTPTTIVFPNVRVGTVENQHVSIGNTATTGAANLDVTLTASAQATASGSITGLAPGATDATDLSVGLNTSSAGADGGVVTENLFSDLGGGNTAPIAATSPYIDVFGGVYNVASASVTPARAIVHVGDPGTDFLTVSNTAEATDGYSENLIAAIAGVIGDFSPVKTGPTGDIAPGGSSGSALEIGFSTASAGTIAGAATLNLITDGGTGSGSIDGLGQLALAPLSLPVDITVDNYASAGLSEVSGGGSWTQSGSNYTLDLGTITAGAPTVVDLGAENTAVAGEPADVLDGAFVAAGDSAFGNALPTFSGIVAGQTGAVGAVTLDTTNAGSFTETVTFDPTGANAAGYSGALAAETLTISATVIPCGINAVPSNNVDDDVGSGSNAMGVTVSGGTNLDVLQGAFASGATVSNSALEIVDGIASATNVVEGGGVYVLSGGTSFATNLEMCGGEFIVAGGVASGTMASEATETTYGTAIGTTLTSGARQYVLGGSAVGTVVDDSVQIVFGPNGDGNGAPGGTALGTMVVDNGYELVSGGTAIGTVLDLGYAFAAVGATMSGTVDSAGGADELGGTTVGTVIDPGSYELVLNVGTALSATVSGGGNQSVYGTASATTVLLGGYEFIGSGGTAIDPSVSSNGYLFVDSGGTAIGTVLQNGYAFAAPGGVLSNTIDLGGGDDVGGTASGTTVGSGGVELVFSGGLTVSATVGSGGAEDIAGSAVGVTVQDGGYALVVSGGVAAGTVVDAGAYAYAASGGTLTGTVDSGGIDEIGAGGTASGTIVSSGGTELMLGSAVGGTVSSGGVEEVYGSATGTTVAGGYAIVVGGGSADGFTIGSAGVAYVAGDASIDGATLSGGALELASGSSAGSAPITFAGNGLLVLNDSAQFGGLVAGFGLTDDLDLTDLPFVASGAGATAASWSQTTSGTTGSGTLTISGGGHSADITLIGQYAASQFNVFNDAQGGTLVTDPPPPTATDLNPMVLTHAQV